MTVPVRSSRLQVHSCYISGGTLTTYAPVDFMDHLKVTSGSFLAHSDVTVGETFSFDGGHLGGTGLTNTFFVKSLVLEDYDGSIDKSITGKKVLIGTEANWTVIAGSRLLLQNEAQLEVMSTATFNLNYQLTYRAQIMGDSSIINHGRFRISKSSGASSNMILFQVDVDNYGSVVVETEAEVQFSNKFLCHGSASLSTGDSAVVQFSGNAQISCPVRGSGILKVSSYFEVAGVSASLDVAAVELSTGTMKIFKSISVPVLMMTGGTLESTHSGDVTVEVSNLFSCRSSTLTSVTVKSRDNSEISGVNNLRDARLQINGKSQFGGFGATSHTVILRGESQLEFESDCTALFAGRHVFSLSESTTSVVINKGEIRTSDLLASISFNLLVWNEGVIDASADSSTVVFWEVSPGFGSVSASGPQSQIQVSGSASQSCYLRLNHICASCVVAVSTSGRAVLNATVTQKLWIPRLESSGRVSFFNGDVAIGSAVLSGQALVELHPSVSIYELYMRDSPQIVGNSDQIDSLVFRGGSCGSTSGPTTTVTVKVLSVYLPFHKKLYQCEMTVTESAYFQYAVLAIGSGSRLRFAASSNVQFKSYTNIVGDNGAMTSGGELINDGTMTVDVPGGQYARFAAYLSNTGTLRVIGGDVTVVADSVHRGMIQVNRGSQLRFEGLFDSSTTTSAHLQIYGSVQVQSTHVQLNFASLNADNIFVESGTLELLDSGCIGQLGVSGGIVDVGALVAVNKFSLAGGTLNARSIFSVNGLARWTGGQISIGGSGAVNLNGPTEIEPGLTGNPAITNAGISF